MLGIYLKQINRFQRVTAVFQTLFAFEGFKQRGDNFENKIASTHITAQNTIQMTKFTT